MLNIIKTIRSHFQQNRYTEQLYNKIESDIILSDDPMAVSIREMLGLPGNNNSFYVTPRVSWWHIKNTELPTQTLLKFIIKTKKNYTWTYLGCGCITANNFETISRQLKTGELYVASIFEIENRQTINAKEVIKASCVVIKKDTIMVINDNDINLKLKLERMDCFYKPKSTMNLIDLKEARRIILALEPAQIVSGIFQKA